MKCYFLVWKVILSQVTLVVLDRWEGEGLKEKGRRPALGNEQCTNFFIAQITEISVKIFCSASWVRMGGIKKMDRENYGWM